MKNLYRPEIDGLRTIAVVSVIFYHAQFNVGGYQFFKGGFLGVDIFFVISGYLITKIILKELFTTEKFSFTNFYERRVRRIIPPLILVMLVSLPFSWKYLLPSSFVDFSKSLLYSLGFSSNYYFFDSGQLYGAETSLYKPFLHTWSLAVEEQFYIFFPIFLFLIFKYFKKYLLFILIFFFIASLLLSEWLSRSNSELNYYFLLTRMWELLAGSILSYCDLCSHHKRNYNSNFIFTCFGFLLILFSIFFFNPHYRHPSLYTLLPVIGACLIIRYSNKYEPVYNMLSSKIFVSVGLISYSLYLWHYPIFAFVRITEFTQGSILKKLLIALILLILSITSYFFIERPARNKKNKYQTLLILLIPLIFFLILFNLNIIKNHGYKMRIPKIINNINSEKPWNLLKNLDNESCHGRFCEFNISSKKEVMIIGDSHMGSLIFDLKNRLVDKNYKFTTSTRGCIYYPGFDKINTITQKSSESCNNNYFIKLKQKLLSKSNSIIIIGGRFAMDITNSLFNNLEGGLERENYAFSDGMLFEKYIQVGKYATIKDSFKNEILEISKKNKIILVYPIPEVGWNVRKKIYSQWINDPKKFTSLKISTSYTVYKNRNKSSFELLNEIKNKNIYRVYPHKIFCNNLIKDRCITHNNENIFYYDEDHLSLEGGKLVNSEIIKIIKKIELNSKILN